MCDYYGIRKVYSRGQKLLPQLSGMGTIKMDKQQHIDKQADTTPLWSLRLCF